VDSVANNVHRNVEEIIGREGLEGISEEWSRGERGSIDFTGDKPTAEAPEDLRLHYHGNSCEWVVQRVQRTYDVIYAHLEP
jgi:hypothetical protein